MAVKYGSSSFSCVSTSLSSPFHPRRVFQVRFGPSVWLPRIKLDFSRGKLLGHFVDSFILWFSIP